LDFYLSETPDGMTGYFIYDPDLFEHASIERLSRRLKTLIRSLLEHPGDSISDLPMDEAATLPALPGLKMTRGAHAVRRSPMAAIRDE